MGSPKSILLPPCFVYISNEWPVALLACRIDLLISSLYRNPQLGGTIRDTEASPPPTRSHEVKDTTRRASYNSSTRAQHGPRLCPRTPCFRVISVGECYDSSDNECGARRVGGPHAAWGRGDVLRGFYCLCVAYTHYNEHFNSC